MIIQNQIDIIDNRNKNRREINNAFIFVIFDIKIRYNNHYKIIKMKFNNKIYIKLHKKYHLFKLKT